jgi:hypothetical protein
VWLLLEKLSFIKDPKRWGYPFRTGQFEITATDFGLIAQAIQLDVKSLSLPHG